MAKVGASALKSLILYGLLKNVLISKNLTARRVDSPLLSHFEVECPFESNLRSLVRRRVRFHLSRSTLVSTEDTGQHIYNTCERLEKRKVEKQLEIYTISVKEKLGEESNIAGNESLYCSNVYNTT